MYNIVKRNTVEDNTKVNLTPTTSQYHVKNKLRKKLYIFNTRNIHNIIMYVIDHKKLCIPSMMAKILLIICVQSMYSY